MQEGIRPGTEKRCELLKICLEKGMSNSMISKIVEPMRGKTEEEKEQIAEKALKELQSENGTSMTNKNNSVQKD